MSRLCRCVFGLAMTAVLSLGLVRHASAQGFSVQITVDENGNGTLANSAGYFSPLDYSLAPDPGPGGFDSALTYDLFDPPGLVPGDVLLLEPGKAGVWSDLIRFNPTSFTGGAGSLVFYSDNGDGSDSLADLGFPTTLYANNISVVEVGSEGANGFVYTPAPGQPGFVAGSPDAPFAIDAQYQIVSDRVLASDRGSLAPEPGPLALLATGALGLLGLLRRQRIVA